MNCTIFKNVFSKDPFYVTIEEALERIKTGKSVKRVLEIRDTLDKEKAAALKANLPSICFSGEFDKNRKDDDLIKHSGFLVLDFDSVDELRDRQTEIISKDFIYSCWVSPSGTGLKALVRIADGNYHREHFQALQDIFPDIDKSGINVSRVCYESYDPDIYVNVTASIFKTIKKIEREYIKQDVTQNDQDVFKKLLIWLSNKNEAFVTGERNNFIFKLACACCKFGIDQLTTGNLISNEFLVNSEFSKSECNRAIKSAYKINASRFATASFQKEVLVDKITKKEIKIEDPIYDEDIRLKDVVFGIDVKDKAMSLYDDGYAKVAGIGVADIDNRFKPKKGELTLLTGIGNYGKSSWKRWYQVMRAVLYDEKFGTFSPEDNPPEEYYHDLVEIILGCDCTPGNPFRPKRDIYEKAYDFVCKHFFYVYPKNVEPTPTYIQEVFLELIIKEHIDGCDIDPFNQLANNYQGFAGRDKYLEWVLTIFARFSVINNIYFWIVAHPIKLSKQTDGNYPCPDVFDVADGSMWNNKMDNILVYHRPFAQSDPQNPTVEFHSKKIRRQKIIGKKGHSFFEMDFSKRRYMFSGFDPLAKIMADKGYDFKFKQASLSIPEQHDGYKPMFEEDELSPF
jgi:hypothetical protein